MYFQRVSHLIRSFRLCANVCGYNNSKHGMRQNVLWIIVAQTHDIFMMMILMIKKMNFFVSSSEWQMITEPHCYQLKRNVDNNQLVIQIAMHLS